MNITKQQLSELEKFQQNLSKYHDAANLVWSARNGRDYVTDQELEKRRKNEQILRSTLNIEYGGLEDLIDEIYGMRPTMIVPSMPGVHWDILAEALGARFSSTKGDCLNMAGQVMEKVVGKARQLVKNPPKSPTSAKSTPIFSDDLLGRVKSAKIKTLCGELNRSWPQNPNGTALLMRTILLVTLQLKMGSTAKEDLNHVLNQSISQDIYKDKQIKKILTNFAAIPKALLDATHHSQWMLLTDGDIDHWLPGLVKIVEATYP